MRYIVCSFVILCTFLHAKQPNILFIFSDDHSPEAIGAYNGFLKGLNPTPNIDQLAAEGMLFEKSFCTNSICGPSRAVILTGKHSHKNGFTGNDQLFDGSQVTVPKLLQNAGYKTAIFGKWHLHSEPQGFDEWKILPGQGLYYNPDFKTANGVERIDGYCTDIVTDLTVDWIKKNAKGEKPFFLMCQHKAPHRNWMPALRHLELYEDLDIPEPASLFDPMNDNASPARWAELEIDGHMDLAFDLFYQLTPDYDGENRKGSFDPFSWLNMKRMSTEQLLRWNAFYGPRDEALEKAQLSGKELTRWKYQQYLKNYLRCVKGVDESVGRLMKSLEELGISDNTIVVYSSDQGFFLGENGWFDKRWMYEESFSMPLIIKWPKVTPEGSRSTQLVQNLDYAQTFLDAAGVPQPEEMQGRSLVNLLKGETPKDWRDGLYYHYYAYPSMHMVAKHNGVRTATHKLIQFYEFGEWELYDLVKDPEERTNLYGTPEYAEVQKELKGKLDDLVKEYEDDTVGAKYSEEKIQSFRVKSNRFFLSNDL